MGQTPGPFATMECIFGKFNRLNSEPSRDCGACRSSHWGAGERPFVTQFHRSGRFSRTYFIGMISGHATTITGRLPNATVHLHAPVHVVAGAADRADELGRDAPCERASQARVLRGGSGSVNDRGRRPHRRRSGANRCGASWREPVELHGHPLRRHHYLRHLLLRRRPLAQRQGQAQAACDPGFLLPDVGSAGTLAGHFARWTAALLWAHAALPHRMRGIRLAVTGARPPGVLLGASADRTRRSSACHSAR